MLRYKLYQNNNQKSTQYGKWYARAVCEETYNLESLAKHMSEHNTPFSAGVIKGVLTDLVACVKELVLDGKNVKLDDLAIFSCGLRTTPADSADKFTAAGNITKVTLRSRATGNLSTSELKAAATIREYTEYSVEAPSTGD
ncbi:MAG: DNA-binding protein [Prevotella sp.]|nr:DNA-binding protein [Prevotella sp.]